MANEGVARAAVAAAFVLVALAALSRSLAAETATFVIQNSHPNALQLEFCSLDRDFSWPGGGQAFVLDGSEPVAFPLNCEAGEAICYGAWVDGDPDTYWGAGRDCAEACSDCCMTCDGSESEVQELGE